MTNEELFERMVKPFSQKDVNRALVLVQELEFYGFTADEFKQLWQKHEAKRAADEIAKNTKMHEKMQKAAAQDTRLEKVRCQRCGQPAKVERVNVCPSTMIGGPWKTSLSCMNEDCRHVEFTKNSIFTYLKGAKK